MPYCQVCLVTVKLSVSVSVNLDVKTIGIRLSVKSIIGLALLYSTAVTGRTFQDIYVCVCVCLK